MKSGIQEFIFTLWAYFYAELSFVNAINDNTMYDKQIDCMIGKEIFPKFIDVIFIK